MRVRPPSFLYGVALLVASLAMPVPACATTVDAPPLDGLLFAAGLVAEAEVLAVDPDVGGSAGAATRIDVRVLDVLVGRAATPGARLSLTLPEGRLADGRFVMLAGAPRLAPGERYLMFLRAGGWHHTPFVGWGHGLLRRVVAHGDARWVLADGRCIAGLQRSGWVPGPRIAGPAPVPAGFVGVAEGEHTPPASVDTTRGTCLSADAVRRALIGRLVELRHAGADRVELRPRAGGWTEAGERP